MAKLWFELWFIILCVVTHGCSTDIPDSRLRTVDSLTLEDPYLAISMLDSIDKFTLDIYNRHYLDFLKIKATDKAYILHVSDSLYLTVKDYFDTHKSNPLYPEVLYYGGRIYSDMGDYPRALEYYKNAFEKLDKKDNDLTMRILSQQSRLFNSLRLYDEAIQAANVSLKVNENLKDTANLISTLQLLGNIYLRKHEYEKSKNYFRKTIELTNDSSFKTSRALSNIYLAELLSLQGKSDSAIKLISENMHNVAQYSENTALIFASDIYLNAGDLETAYIYATQLIESNLPYNKQNGFENLFSSELFSMIPVDSIVSYIRTYHTLLEKSYNNNEAQLAIQQKSFYNYYYKEEQYKKTEKKNIVLVYCITGFVILSIFLIMIILFIKEKNKNTILELKNTISSFEHLENNLKNVNQIRKYAYNPDIADLFSTNATKGEMKDLLKNKITEIANFSKEKFVLDDKILISKTYAILTDFIRKKIVLNDENPFWNDIENLVLHYYPEFTKNLTLLMGKNLSIADYHTSLLIKLNITPSEIGQLMGRSRNAINSRRTKLCIQIFGEDKGMKYIDNIIRLL